MAVHKLTKNFRASKAVLEWVNQNNPRGTRIEQNDAQTTGLDTQSDGGFKTLERNSPNDVASKIKSALESKQKVALLCRTNEECYRWQDFLENYREGDEQNQSYPLKNKTRLIDEKPTKIHYTWPVWWFFHGYADLHPVLPNHFSAWKQKLGLNGEVTEKKISYPTKSPDSTQETHFIAEIPDSCTNDSLRLRVNGRLRSGESMTVTEAIEKLRKEVPAENPFYIFKSLQSLDTNHEEELSENLTTQFCRVIEVIKKSFGPDQNVTWREIWQAFEDYYEDPNNLLASDRVTISTIHKSKGLEFDTVFLCDWEKRTKDDQDKKVYYVGGSRAKENLYIIPHTIKPETSSPYRRIAHINEINASKAVHQYIKDAYHKRLFGYKDPENKDYSYAYHNEHVKLCNSSPAPISMEANWGKYKMGEIPRMKARTDSKKYGTIYNYQEWLSQESGSYLNVLYWDKGIPIMIHSEYGWHPAILPAVSTLPSNTQKYNLVFFLTVERDKLKPHSSCKDCSYIELTEQDKTLINSSDYFTLEPLPQPTKLVVNNNFLYEHHIKLPVTRNTASRPTANRRA